MLKLSNPHIAVLGAGAVGGYVGGQLAHAGYHVDLVDTWADHVNYINANGIHLSDPTGGRSIKARALHIHEVQQFVRDRVDLAFICTKSYDSAWMARMIRPYLSEGGCVVSLQNSINEGEIARIVGDERTLGCIASTISVMLLKPGCIHRARTPGGENYTVFRVGELHGRITPRAAAIAGILASVDSAKVTTNLWGERWAKLVTNSMHHGILGAAGISDHALMNNPQTRELAIRCAGEAIRVAQALGHDLEPILRMSPALWEDASRGRPVAVKAIEEGWLKWMERSKEPHFGSVGHDLKHGRRTEIDWTCGYVAKKGASIGRPAPTQAALADLVRSVERGEITQGLENLDALLIERSP